MRPGPALAPPGPPPGAGAMAFTFAAFCYMLTLVLCASLIFFVIWHVRPGWGWGWGRSGGRGRWEQEGDGRMVSRPGETWSLLSAIPHQSATVRPINTPHHRLPSRAPPLSPPPPTICGYVSRSLTPLPCPMAALGCGAEFWDSCSFPSYFPTPQPPPSSRPRLSVGQFVCLLSPPPLWVFPARVMEPVAMATASVYRTHRSQSPLTLSIPAPHPHSLTQQ